MKIVVFIKQVADNTRLRFQDGKAITDGAPVMMNPFDEYALETALRLKEQAGGDSTVVAISLGASNIKDTLKKAVAAGADEAIALVDAQFDAGDSATTAVALAAAVQQKVPEFGVLIFGQMALDDAALQGGPRVAALLDIPATTFVKDAKVSGSTFTISRETVRGTEEWSLEGKAALCVMKCDYELRASNIKGVMKANKTDIPVLSASELNLSGDSLKPAVKVLKTWQRPAKSTGKVIDGADPKGAVEQLMGYLHDAKVL